MRLPCRRRHIIGFAGRGPDAPPIIGDPWHKSTHDWLVCFIVHHGMSWSGDGHQGTHLSLAWLLVRMGFLDTDSEGGHVYLRWDFWNGKMARYYQEVDFLPSGYWTSAWTGKPEWKPRSLADANELWRRIFGE